MLVKLSACEPCKKLTYLGQQVNNRRNQEIRSLLLRRDSGKPYIVCHFILKSDDDI